MRRPNNGQIHYSPTDLVRFLGCRHAIFLDNKTSSEKLKNDESSITAQSSKNMKQLLWEKGLEHERAYLGRLKDEGKSVKEIPKAKSPQERAALTEKAIKSGVDVIYQGVFVEHSWRGDADFLMKCDAPSNLGDFSYEVLDTKLSRMAEPKHIMQLCAYSELLAALQGLRPFNMHLVLGDGEKHSFRVADFFYYYRRAKGRFESYVQNLPEDSYPEPCSYCQYCRWRSGCKAQWEKDDHLSLVANITRSQMDKLRKTGIQTVADLANAGPNVKKSDFNPEVFQRLCSQAGLQRHKAKTGEDVYVLIRPFLPGKGFFRMPEPDDGDLFFDMEGDPLYPRGLEYLFGVYYLKDGKEVFKPYWGHDHEKEKEAFRQFMGFLAGHLAKHPQAHIYHYNHYETTALKRLACRYALCEEQLDNFLRTQKFVDLYLVVRESIRSSEPGYSIKNLETFYMDKREGEVATAAESIIVYNEWRETNDKTRLREIADYNKIDCVSTLRLRDWLLSLRPKHKSKGLLEKESEKELKQKDWEKEHEKCKEKLGMNSKNPPPINERLGHLLEFHSREAKPQWRNIFDRQKKTEDELIDDTNCIGGMELYGSPQRKKSSSIYTYSFPPQEFRMEVGSQVLDTALIKSAGTIDLIDEDNHIVKIKRAASENPLPNKLSIGPPGRLINTEIIRKAIYNCAEDVIKAPERARAATEILGRNLPRIQGKQPGDAIIGSDDLHSDSLKAIAALDNSYLIIQGPPGAGKTYISSHIIVELIRRGKKIGVTSNTHKAIHNLLEEVENVAAAEAVRFHGIKKASDRNNEKSFEGQFIHTEIKTEKMNLDADLFAGTAWTFADSHFAKKNEPRLDYLFIDEAGQVATANVIAMAGSARNIILVGDQMQLGQPIQGTHPGEAGLSVLEFLLNDYSTIPPERGIFLKETRRMRPSICRFISDAFYDGRLTAHECAKKRSLSLQGVHLPNEGIVMIPADHEGCSHKSEEEGKIIKARYQSLLGQSFTGQEGGTRPISKDDILVVTPYNAQVNYLRSILPDNAKVGTADRFQGQQAPIVFISMVRSSAEDMPRNIKFLYSKNRLNVAISRAQCLAVVVANPNLLETPCGTVEQMKLVNTFCWLNEYANA